MEKPPVHRLSTHHKRWRPEFRKSMMTHLAKAASTLKFCQKTADKSQSEECRQPGRSLDCTRQKSHRSICQFNWPTRIFSLSRRSILINIWRIKLRTRMQKTTETNSRCASNKLALSSRAHFPPWITCFSGTSCSRTGRSRETNPF